jgi:DnaK suppressor protein
MAGQQGAGHQSMKKTELARFKKILEDLRARATGDIHQLGADVAASERGAVAKGPRADPTDQGAEIVEAEFNFNLLKNQNEVLEQIEAALKRIEQGDFGACVECSATIPKERLEFLPYAARCVNCARKLEQS